MRVSDSTSLLSHVLLLLLYIYENICQGLRYRNASSRVIVRRVFESNTNARRENS